ncbi:PAC2 family protein [Bifidobacterium xylocopae]|uniref:PAC2 family protein n=1 Tax=Bifidobacterium xylocopae TaxID=2493119 RepID=A0A366KDV0_9BIFI|nr:PAC2 family protein [Bifidobacterium xylocopae]RBP99293.1 PAC2 family protein [Bifidobacterium xylocopae]
MSEEAKPRRYPLLLAAFDGWNDACSASTNVIRHLLNAYQSREVGGIGCEGFYDYQVARPMLCHVQGRRSICWPETKFYEVRLTPEVSLLVETGPEPNYRWEEYCKRSIRMAEDYDVGAIVTLGSMFADCPHTRALPIDDLASDEADVDTEGHSGPVGIPTVLEALAREAGFETETVWVSVPQYLGSDECAQGTLQLLRRVSGLLGLPLDEGDLPQRADHWRAQASVLTRCNDDLAEYVRRLEVESDSKAASSIPSHVNDPTARELVREAEEFLRSMDGPGKGD